MVQIEEKETTPIRLSSIERSILNALACAHTETDSEFITLTHVKRCANEQFPLSVLLDGINLLLDYKLVGKNVDEEFALSLKGFLALKKFPELFDDRTRNDFLEKITCKELLGIQIHILNIMKNNIIYISESELNKELEKLSEEKWYIKREHISVAIQSLIRSEVIELSDRGMLSISSRMRL